MASDRTRRMLMAQAQRKEQEFAGASHDKAVTGREFPDRLRPGRQLAISMSDDERAQPYRRAGRRLLGS